MRTLTLKNKIISLSVILLVLMTGCVIVTIYSLYLNDITARKVKSVVRIQEKFQDLRFYFEKSLMAPHDYLINGNEDEKEIFKGDLEEVLVKRGELKNLIAGGKVKADSEFKQIYEKVEKLFLHTEEKASEYETKAQKIMDIENPVGNPMAGSYMESMDLSVRVIEDDYQKIEKILSALVDRTRNQRDLVNRNIIIMSIILGILVVLVGTILSYYIIQSITRPVGNLLAVIRKITGGDLTVRARVDRDDEIGELARSFNNMVEELVITKERISGILQSSGDGVYVIDKDFNVLQANMEMEKFIGVPAEKFVGKKCYEFFCGEFCHTDSCVLKLTLSGEKRIDTESIKEAPDGRKIPFHIIATPLMEHGKCAGVIECIRDITEHKNAADTLRKSHDELEEALRKLRTTQAQMLQSEKMASIGQLAAGVAHEINNPAGFVSSNLKTLSDYHNDINTLIEQYRSLTTDLKETMAIAEYPVAISEQLERIADLETEVDIDFVLNDISDLVKESREGTERIKKIVLDLKDFAHPGEDKPQLADINRNMESTLNVVWNELKYKATVTKDYRDLPEVECYPQQLNQVFMNLLVNAAQAIEKQGEIRIVTRSVNGYAEIKISDTGKGIPEENLSKIFDPFFTTKEVGRGTGLGLNVAYNIIKKHNGTIDVESTVGKGTMFTIRIPVQKEV
jgi:PAS domain S-box-containing protein